MRIRILSSIFFGLFPALAFALNQQQEDKKLVQIEDSLRVDIPRILCVNENIATGAQPKQEAFAKLAQNGFRSVLSLRTDQEGVDLKKDRKLTEAAGMRYIHIPVVTADPDPKRVDEFIRAVEDRKNHPMLLYCGSANRVGAFWMIYRVVQNGWTEEKAMEEAVKIGLTRPQLKAFVQSYLAKHKSK
jgi:cytochrome b6-f complex iron-sulfur subunit